MKIILKQSVEALGAAGDIVNVKSGYGRNFLIPQGLGTLATAASIEATKNQIEQQAMKNAKSKNDLQLIADKLNTLKLTFSSKAGEDDKLFGSITTQMIADELNDKGFKVDKKYISVDKPIKNLGNYFATVDFGDSIDAHIKLKVVSETE